MPQVQSDPIYSLPFTYVSGLLISKASDTTLSVASGQCRDSNDIIDMPIGSAPLNGATTTAPVTLNFGVIGYNGIDTGAIAASTMYAVYVIGDSSYHNPVGVIATLASNSTPLMPFGYDSRRLIGYWATDGSSHLILGYMSGTGNTRMFTYDAPIATAVTAGNATSYTGVVLTTLVSPQDSVPVVIQSDFTANAAADTLKLQGYDSTGDAITIIAPVAGATAHTFSYSTVLSQLNTAAPSIKYKVSAGAAAVALNVASFTFSI